MKLLIAEDDAFFRKILHMLLCSEIQIITAENGTEAWQRLKEIEWPVLAILDWVMPGMSGHKFVARRGLAPKLLIAI